MTTTTPICHLRYSRTTRISVQYKQTTEQLKIGKTVPDYIKEFEADFAVGHNVRLKRYKAVIHGEKIGRFLLSNM